MAEATLNPFIGKAENPTDADLSVALADAKPVWDRLIADLATGDGVAIQEWKSYSLKAGWSLRLKRGKRTVLWLAPGQCCFQAIFILGDKALLAARQAGLPAQTLRALDEAVKYPEGTGIRLLIRRPKDLPQVRKLAAVKLAN